LACATGLQVDVNAASGSQLSAGQAHEGVQAHYVDGDDTPGSDVDSNETDEVSEEGSSSGTTPSPPTPSPPTPSPTEGLTDMATTTLKPTILNFVHKGGKLQKGGPSPRALEASEGDEDHPDDDLLHTQNTKQNIITVDHVSTDNLNNTVHKGGKLQEGGSAPTTLEASEGDEEELDGDLPHTRNKEENIISQDHDSTDNGVKVQEAASSPMVHETLEGDKDLSDGDSNKEDNFITQDHDSTDNVNSSVHRDGKFQEAGSSPQSLGASEGDEDQPDGDLPDMQSEEENIITLDGSTQSFVHKGGKVQKVGSSPMALKASEGDEVQPDGDLPDMQDKQEDTDTVDNTAQSFLHEGGKLEEVGSSPMALVSKKEP